MIAILSVEWVDHGHEPQCVPNPDYPQGIDVNVSMGAKHSCMTAEAPGNEDCKGEIEMSDTSDDAKIFVITLNFITRQERDRAAKLINAALDGGNVHHSGLCMLEEGDDGAQPC
jgi:hypothetical protein